MIVIGIDKSGPTAKEYLLSYDLQNDLNLFEESLIDISIVPDNEYLITNKFKLWTSNTSNKCDLILTSGGTGFGDKDITPEVTKKFIEKECNGLITAMLNYSLNCTKFAALSRYKSYLISLDTVKF